MKEILVVNDDGIFSQGLKSAIKVAKMLGNVTVVAPAVQRSGVSRSISLFSPVSVSEVYIEGVKAYSISGTPVDAVLIGIYGIVKKIPDLVISGINVGENLSYESLTSGTVGAAIEAANQGAKAISISLATKEEKIKFDNIHDKIDFSIAEEVLYKVSLLFLEGKIDAEVLNINVPEKPRKRVIKVTKLAERMYKTKLEERYDPRGRKYYWIDGEPLFECEDDTDVTAVRKEEVISITPIKLDMTDYDKMEELSNVIKSITL